MGRAIFSIFPPMPLWFLSWLPRSRFFSHSQQMLSKRQVSISDRQDAPTRARQAAPRP